MTLVVIPNVIFILQSAITYADSKNERLDTKLLVGWAVEMVCVKGAKIFRAFSGCVDGVVKVIP